MNAWHFKSKDSPKETIEKLEAELKSIGGFAFDTNYKNNDSVIFSMRKRILYPWYMAFQNWTTVKGELLKVQSENQTSAEITFKQHFLIQLIVFTHFFLGLAVVIAIISGSNKHWYMYALGGTLFALGVVLWISLKSKFKKDAEHYKTLITQILDL